MSSFLFILDAIYNVVNIDCKKWSDSEKAAFNFRTKKISVYSINDDIIEKIHKFLFSLQNLLIKEAYAIIDKIKKGKDVSGLTMSNYHYLFWI